MRPRPIIVLSLVWITVFPLFLNAQNEAEAAAAITLIHQKNRNRIVTIPPGAPIAFRYFPAEKWQKSTFRGMSADTIFIDEGYVLSEKISELRSYSRFTGSSLLFTGLMGIIVPGLFSLGLWWLTERLFRWMKKGRGYMILGIIFLTVFIAPLIAGTVFLGIAGILFFVGTFILGLWTYKIRRKWRIQKP